MAGHGEVALVSILVGSTPGVMNAHWIVGGDGTVQEGPLRPAAIFVTKLVKGVGALPKFQNSPHLSREIDLRFDLLEGHVGSLELGCQKLYLIKDEYFAAIEENSMGRFSVDLLLGNKRDMILAQEGSLPLEKVRKVQCRGVVDPGA